MPYCNNCGHPMIEGAKFCLECGKKQNDVEEMASQRKIVYEGELHKFPNCSNLLNAFEMRCEMCGYELRGTQSSNSLRNFTERIRDLEGENGKAKWKRIVTYISTFPIPNTREDLMEFLILSSTNINEENRYKDETSNASKAISDAWLAKFEQAYYKALVVFADAPELMWIQDLYAEKKKIIKKKKFRSTLIYWVPPVVAVFLMLVLIVTLSIIDMRENARLEKTVNEVYQAIEVQDYVLARAKAATVVWDGIEDEDKTKKWDKVRKDLLQVIDEAELAQKKLLYEEVMQQFWGD